MTETVAETEIETEAERQPDREGFSLTQDPCISLCNYYSWYIAYCSIVYLEG